MSRGRLRGTSHGFQLEFRVYYIREELLCFLYDGGE